LENQDNANSEHDIYSIRLAKAGGLNPILSEMKSDLNISAGSGSGGI